MILRYAHKPERRSKIHDEIERRCGVSEEAASLLVELDLFGEVLIDRDEHMPALFELRAKGLADRADAPYACTRAIAGAHVREVMNHIRAIGALERELAESSARSSESISAAGSGDDRGDDGPRRAPDRGRDVPHALTPKLERAIIEDALALIDQNPMLPAAADVRVYLRPGRRFTRVFWTNPGAPEGHGSILYFVENETGRVHAAKSARQVGGPTGRVVGLLGGRQ